MSYLKTIKKADRFPGADMVDDTDISTSFVAGDLIEMKRRDVAPMQILSINYRTGICRLAKPHTLNEVCRISLDALIRDWELLEY